MANIGERLTEARKNFGIDIRSAAEATKIRSDFLAALEENKPEKIKLADVYKVGFLRIYAKYLKLDADRIVAEFRTNLSLHGGVGHRVGHRAHNGGESAGTGVSGMDSSSVFSERSGGFSLEKFLRSGGGRLIAWIAVAAVLIIGGAFAVLSFFDGGEETPVASAVTPSAANPQSYEFQLISKIPQRVTITDCYVKGGGGGPRAKVLDNVQVSANRPMILRARGVLEIQDSGNENLEIRFPSREALLASTNANVPVKFKEEEASTAFKHSANYWTADPLWSRPVSE